MKRLIVMVLCLSFALSTVANAKTKEDEKANQEKIMNEVIKHTEEVNALLDSALINEATDAEKKASDKTKAVVNAMLGKDVYETKVKMKTSKEVADDEAKIEISYLYDRDQTGNYLVTTDGWVGQIPLPGHAGMVYSSSLTIESFADGVNWHLYSHWEDDYDKVFEYYVNAYGNQPVYAVQYATQQIGDPYNYNFFNVLNEDKFYCSQLVWRAWYEAGYDLDGITNGVVAPVDLTEADDATIIYSSLW